MNARRLRFSPFSTAIILSTGIVSALWAMLAMPLNPQSMSGSGVSIAEELKILPTTTSPPAPGLHEYIEIMEGCGPYYNGEDCVRTYSGASEDYRVINRLQIGRAH